MGINEEYLTRVKQLVKNSISINKMVKDEGGNVDRRKQLLETQHHELVRLEIFLEKLPRKETEEINKPT